MRQYIINHLEGYSSFFKEEKDSFGILKKQIKNSENLTDRKNMNGHVTASGLVISPKGEVLLIFHKVGGRFQQPGGHIDASDENVVAAAMREVYEETSLRDVSLHPWHEKHPHPINIDSHYIAPRAEKEESEHYHHDFLYVFSSRNTKITLQQEEVGDFKWINPQRDTLESLHIERSIQKAIALKIL